jgi:RNA recognition motif-containing protein
MCVGHLACTVTAQDLRALFAPYGVVDCINLLTDRETGRPRGVGCIAMADDRAAQATIAGLQGTDFAWPYLPCQ